MNKIKNAALINSLGLLTIAVSATLGTSLHAAEKLFIKIEDLVPSGEAKNHGSDIEAVELRSPDGLSLHYATNAVAPELPVKEEQPKDEKHGKMTAQNIRGVPILIDMETPYVYSLNGSWVVAELDFTPMTNRENWQLTVYEVDGSLYSWGDGPEPYKVSIASSNAGPWQSLGIGSGTSRFSLAGKKTKTLTPELLAEIKKALAEKPKNIEPTEEMKTKFELELARLKSLKDIAQVEAELVGFEKFFHYKEHVVNSHGDKDKGTVMVAWHLLHALYTRYEQLKKG
jgi:hypothetical protein